MSVFDNLVKIKVAKEIISLLGIFDDKSVNFEFLAKVPDFMVEQWKKIASDKLDSGKAFSIFSV